MIKKQNKLIYSLIKKQVNKNNPDAFLNGSNLRYTNRRAMAKLLAHYEIYKMVKDLPGHVVELGVFKGESILRFGQFAEIFNNFDRSFDIIGFDNFSGFTKLSKQDGKKNIRNDKKVGGWSSENYKDELYSLVDHFDMTRMGPQKPRIKLIDGENIEETVPKFKKDYPNLRIKLSHLDADLYEPTMVGLENFWDNLVVGGLLAIRRIWL